MYVKYPVVSLPKILIKLRENKNLQPIMTVKEFANSCGYSYPANGTASNFIFSCAAFGIIKSNYKGASVELTTLGNQLLSKDASSITLLSILTTPKVFSDIHIHFEDDKIPFLWDVVQYLQSYCSFTDHEAKKAARIYRESVEYVYRYVKKTPPRKKIANQEALVTILYENTMSLTSLLEATTNMIKDEMQKQENTLTSIDEVKFG